MTSTIGYIEKENGNQNLLLDESRTAFEIRNIAGTNFMNGIEKWINEAINGEMSLNNEQMQALELYNIKKSRLRILEQQAALYGIACPPHIILEIEYLRKEIVAIQRSMSATS